VTFQLISNAGNTYRFNNLGGEPANQNSFRLIFRNTTALEVKDSIRIELADGGAVETPDVVVANFKLRFRIDLSVSREKQQPPTELGRRMDRYARSRPTDSMRLFHQQR